MNSDEMKQRTREFALRVIRLVGALPKDRVGDTIGRQLLRSGTSIGANDREAIRASSKKHFVSILEIVQREIEETAYWFELILVPSDRLNDIRVECSELAAIVTASIRTSKRRLSGE